MRLTGTLATQLIVQSALLVCASCDSQVSDRYEGESLLTIRGSVVQTGTVTSDLVPVLGFRDSLSGPLVEPRRDWLIEGHVTGDFPAKFRVDFTQPPPDFTFTPPNSSQPDGGPWNQGSFYLVPRNHPAAYPEYPVNIERLPEQDAVCDAGNACTGQIPDTNSYVEKHTICESENHCKVSTYQCHNEPCQLLYSAGDPALETSEKATRHDSSGPYGHGTLHALTYYDPGDINHSYRTVRACGDSWKLPMPGGLSGLDQDTHGIEANSYCTPIEKAGEDFADYSDIPWRASTFFVVYSKVDGLYFPSVSEDPRSARLARGYNVIKAETIFTEDESIAAVNCLEDLEATAITEINAAHGTRYVPLPFGASYPDGFPIAEFAARREELRQNCPEMLFRYHTVPPSEPLDIELGSATAPLTP